MADDRRIQKMLFRVATLGIIFTAIYVSRKESAQDLHIEFCLEDYTRFSLTDVRKCHYKVKLYRVSHNPGQAPGFMRSLDRIFGVECVRDYVSVYKD